MLWFLLGLTIGAALSALAAALYVRRSVLHVRRSERRARTAERLRDLTMLTSGLAHEIKNPLSTVGLNVQLLREDVDELSRGLDDESPTALGLRRVDRRLDALMRETQRLRDILEDFLKFAGRIRLERRPIEIATVIDQLVDFFEPQAQAAGVRLRTQLASTPTVHADPDLLKQALLNLLFNAVQAMQHTRQDRNASHGGADELFIRTETLSPNVLIHVTDTGPGVPTEIIDKIFQPYFSNRPGGSGLGLAVSRRLIEEHGGRLFVHSEPGQGSDFVIELPLDNNAVDETQSILRA